MYFIVKSKCVSTNSLHNLLRKTFRGDMFKKIFVCKNKIYKKHKWGLNPQEQLSEIAVKVKNSNQ